MRPDPSQRRGAGPCFSLHPPDFCPTLPLFAMTLGRPQIGFCAVQNCDFKAWRWVVSLRRLLVISIVILLAAVAYRVRPTHADEWLPISPEDLKMTSAPEAPG